MSSWEAWAMLAVSAVVIPCVAWLVKEVLTLRADFVRLQERSEQRHQSLLTSITSRDEFCTKHIEQQGAVTAETFKTLNRLDRNIVRLCQKAQLDYEEP